MNFINPTVDYCYNRLMIKQIKFFNDQTNKVLYQIEIRSNVV